MVRDPEKLLMALLINSLARHPLLLGLWVHFTDQTYLRSQGFYELQPTPQSNCPEEWVFIVEIKSYLTVLGFSVMPIACLSKSKFLFLIPEV